MFMWKCFRKALPVGEGLASRHINIEPLCKRCNTLESINHLFLQCPFAKEVWGKAPFTQEVGISGSIDLKDVWLQLCSKSCLPPSGVALGPLAPWILWQLWISRNALVFNNRTISADETLSKAIASAREWQTNQTMKPTGQLAQTTREANPPSTICFTLQTDAAWIPRTKTAGLGWNLISPSTTHSFAEIAPSTISPLAAESLALRQGLRYCRNMGIKEVRCQSDSTQLIKAIKENNSNMKIYGSVSDILFMIECFKFIFFEWI